MQAVGLRKAFDGCDLAPYDGACARDAGPLRPAVDQNRARAALPFATAILGSGQVELIAEDAQKCGVGVGKMSIPIHVESNSGHATTSGGRICGVIMIYRLRLRFRIGSMGSFPPVYRPCVHWC